MGAKLILCKRVMNVKFSGTDLELNFSKVTQETLGYSFHPSKPPDSSRHPVIMFHGGYDNVTGGI